MFMHQSHEKAKQAALDGCNYTTSAPIGDLNYQQQANELVCDLLGEMDEQIERLQMSLSPVLRDVHPASEAEPAPARLAPPSTMLQQDAIELLTQVERRLAALRVINSRISL